MKALLIIDMQKTSFEPDKEYILLSTVNAYSDLITRFRNPIAKRFECKVD